jgi:hypothetical protein
MWENSIANLSTFNISKGNIAMCGQARNDFVKRAENRPLSRRTATLSEQDTGP